MAFSLFLSCDFSSWHCTTMPVGRWVMRIAVSVRLTYWPPAPEAQYVSMRRSAGAISTSTSSASGKTATVTADVWMRPLDSVTGTRCTRCVPLSYFKKLYAPAPSTEKEISLKPPISVAFLSMTSTRQPRRSA